MKNKLLCLVIMLCLMLSACADSGETSEAVLSEAQSDTSVSEAESEISLSESDALLRDTARELLKLDRAVTDIFVRGSLNGGKTNTVTKSAEGEYASFSAVTKLLDSVYAPSGSAKEYYLSFPDYGENSLSESADGRTLYRYSYIDATEFDINIFSLDDGIITVGDKSVKMVLTDGGYRLDGSLYIEYASKPASPPESAYMNIGSAKTLCGNILAVKLYTTGNNAAFDEAAEAGIDKIVAESLEYIQTQAQSYSAELTFTEEKLFFRHGGELLLDPEHPFNLEIALTATTFGSLDGMIKESFDTALYDGYLVFVCSPGNESGYPVAYCDGDAKAFSCERLVISESCTPDIVVPCVLQLFGAERDSNSAVRSYIKDDIVYDNIRLEGSGVRELNAYRLGWLKSVSRQLWQFI